MNITQKSIILSSLFLFSCIGPSRSQAMQVPNRGAWVALGTAMFVGSYCLYSWFSSSPSPVLVSPAPMNGNSNSTDWAAKLDLTKLPQEVATLCNELDACETTPRRKVILLDFLKLLCVRYGHLQNHADLKKILECELGAWRNPTKKRDLLQRIYKVFNAESSEKLVDLLSQLETEFGMQGVLPGSN